MGVAPPLEAVNELVTDFGVSAALLRSGPTRCAHRIRAAGDKTPIIFRKKSNPLASCHLAHPSSPVM